MTSETDALVDSYLRGAAEAEDVRRLDGILRQDPGARRTLLLASQIEVELPRVLAEAPARVADEVWLAARSRQARGGKVPADAGSRPDSGRARFPVWWIRSAAVGAAAALLMALGVHVWSGRAGARGAGEDRTAVRVSCVGGSVWRSSPSGSLLAAVRLQDGDLLAPGERMRCGRDGRATLIYADGSAVEVGENSRLFTSSGTRIRALHLESGQLLARIAPQDGGHKIVFITPHAVTTVVGTRFRLRADVRTSSIEVQEGKVAVVSIAGSPAEAFMVEAHESVVVGESRVGSRVAAGQSSRPAAAGELGGGSGALRMAPARLASTNAGPGRGAAGVAPPAEALKTGVYEYLGETVSRTPCGLYSYFTIRVRDLSTGKVGAFGSAQSLAGRFPKGSRIALTLQKAFGWYWVKSCEPVDGEAGGRPGDSR